MVIGIGTVKSCIYVVSTSQLLKLFKKFKLCIHRIYYILWNKKLNCCIVMITKPHR